MGVEEVLHCSRVDQASLTGAAVQQHVAHDRLPPFSRPLAERNREAHLLARQDFIGQQSPNGLAQDALGREAAQLEPIRKPRGELDKHVIEKRHAALDRGRHAHLVLLHQELDEVRLDVGMQKPPEDPARPVDLVK